MVYFSILNSSGCISRVTDAEKFSVCLSLCRVPAPSDLTLFSVIRAAPDVTYGSDFSLTLHLTHFYSTAVWVRSMLSNKMSWSLCVFVI